MVTTDNTINILWHDPNVNNDENTGYQYDMNHHMPDTVKSLVVRDTPESAFQYIRDNRSKVDVLMSSGRNGEQLLQLLMKNDIRLSRVVIFCYLKSPNIEWAKKYGLARYVLDSFYEIKKVLLTFQERPKNTVYLQPNPEITGPQSAKGTLVITTEVPEEAKKVNLENINGKKEVETKYVTLGSHIMPFDTLCGQMMTKYKLAKFLITEEDELEFIRSLKNDPSCKDVDKTITAYESKIDPILLYTYETFLYKKLNSCLRSNDMNEFAMLSNFAQKLMKRLREQVYVSGVENKIVWRLAQFQDKQIEIFRKQLDKALGINTTSGPKGKLKSEEQKYGTKITTYPEIIFPGFTSTTLNKSSIANFFPSNTLMKIIIPAGLEKEYLPVYIGDISVYQDEEEVLFQMGSTFSLRSLSETPDDIVKSKYLIELTYLKNIFPPNSI